MAKENPYLIPVETVCVEQEIKRSRFIATVGRAMNKKEANAFIATVRSTYPDANHHCWAYVAGNPFDTVQIGMSDDGEPQGTAGKPILSVLQYKRIVEVVAVVSRYFGGIKLGAGGLVRAYSSSVQLALQQLSLEEFVVRNTAQISLPYPYENAIRRLLEKMRIKIVQVIYKDGVVMNVKVPENASKELRQQIADQSHGNAKIRWLKENA